jgi:hypothetical protein
MAMIKGSDSRRGAEVCINVGKNNKYRTGCDNSIGEEERTTRRGEVGVYLGLPGP